MLRSGSAEPSSASATGGRTKYVRTRPSLNILVIVGAALIGLGVGLLALGIYHAFEHGTCSTTGYSQYYGPVPHCAKGIGWWVLLIFGGLIIAGGGTSIFVLGRDNDVTPASAVGGLALCGAGVAVAFVIAGAINSAIGPTKTSGTTTNAGSAPRFDPTSITPTDSRSMFHTTNLRAALTNLEGRIGSGARTGEFVIYPGYVNVIGQQGSSQLWAVLYVGGRYRQDNSGTANTSQPTFPLSQVDVTQPAALAKQLTTYNHVPESQLRYMVMTIEPTSNQPMWLIYTRGDSNPFTYTPSGGSPKSNGTSGSAASSGGAATAGGTSNSSVSKAEALANCVSKAGTDTAKILACTGG